MQSVRFMPLFLGSLLIGGALIAISGCAKETTGEAAEEPAASTVPVAVEILRPGTMESTLSVWAGVHPLLEADLNAGISGRIDAVYAGLGDSVKKGRRLLEIDAAVHAAAFAEAAARHESAGIALEKAEKDLQRSDEMFRVKSISDSEWEEVRARQVAATAEMAAAAARLAQARRTLTDARVSAPFDGIVAVDPPDPGTSISLGAPLTRIVALDRVRVVARVSEQDLPAVLPGGTARVTVEGLPGRVFSGTVVAVGPEADADSRQFPVEIQVVNPAGFPLKAGMVARVEIVTEVLEDALLLPVDALVEDDDGWGYFAVDDGVAHWRPVITGPRNAGRVALRDGGAAGDSVVVLGQARLAEGSRVTVETAP